MIELRGVSCTYVSAGRGRVVTTRAVTRTSLVIPDLQFLCIVGPSGSGKTTLLRLIAGLTAPTEGEVFVDGCLAQGPGPDRAVVFQSSALYPWRTVEANVRLGLELSRLARGRDADEIVRRHLGLVGLSDFADHYPAQLSGGMQQRVGLARALAVSPSHLLMDEPFGALDTIMRRELGAELLRLWEEEQRTVVFVTHSIEEALVLSDRVVVMREGAIVEDVPVELPRPRRLDTVVDDPLFVSLRRMLTELL